MESCWVVPLSLSPSFDITGLEGYLTIPQIIVHDVKYLQQRENYTQPVNNCKVKRPTEKIPTRRTIHMQTQPYFAIRVTRELFRQL